MSAKLNAHVAAVDKRLDEEAAAIVDALDTAIERERLAAAASTARGVEATAGSGQQPAHVDKSAESHAIRP